jgi:hypothetical protein
MPQGGFEGHGRGTTGIAPLGERPRADARFHDAALETPAPRRRERPLSATKVSPGVGGASDARLGALITDLTCGRISRDRAGSGRSPCEGEF